MAILRTFSPYIALADIPESDIRKGYVYWISDDVFAGRHALCRHFVATGDEPGTKAGYVYIATRCPMSASDLVVCNDCTVPRILAGRVSDCFDGLQPPQRMDFIGVPSATCAWVTEETDPGQQLSYFLRLDYSPVNGLVMIAVWRADDTLQYQGTAILPSCDSGNAPSLAGAYTLNHAAGADCTFPTITATIIQ